MRLFQSDVFDAHLHMYYLHKMSASGVQDYLVNQLYRRSDPEIQFYLPQLAQMSTSRMSTSSLHRYLMDKACTNTMFALKIHWYFQSIVEDDVSNLRQAATRLWQDSEMAIVNSQEWKTWCTKSAHLRRQILNGQPPEYLLEADRKQPGMLAFIEHAIRCRGFGADSLVAQSADQADQAMTHLREMSASLQAAIQVKCLLSQLDFIAVSELKFK